MDPQRILTPTTVTGPAPTSVPGPSRASVPAPPTAPQQTPNLAEMQISANCRSFGNPELRLGEIRGTRPGPGRGVAGAVPGITAPIGGAGRPG